MIRFQKDLIQSFFEKPDEKQLELFLCGKGKDNKGRYIEDILAQDNEWWESTHDYIQWIFPTDIKSKYNKSVPVVKVPVRIQATFMPDSYIRFRQFLQETAWKEHYHNRLRITRVLRSLSLFGYTELSYGFLNELLVDQSLEDSFSIWKKNACCSENHL